MSADFASDVPWKEKSIAAVKAEYADDVRVYTPTRADRWHRRLLDNYYRYFGRQVLLDSGYRSPVRMRSRFEEIVRELSPDTLFVNYAYWDRLIYHRRHRNLNRVIDSHDLVSLNEAMQTRLREDLLRPLADCHSDPLSLNYYEKLSSRILPQELQTYRRYSHLISISQDEAKLIGESAPNTKVTRIPVTCKPRFLENTYAGSCLFTASPNALNLQGYLTFVKRVLRSSADTAQTSCYRSQAGCVTSLGFLPPRTSRFAASLKTWPCNTNRPVLGCVRFSAGLVSRSRLSG